MMLRAGSGAQQALREGQRDPAFRHGAIVVVVPVTLPEGCAGGKRPPGPVCPSYAPVQS